jgi:hypothetical protein
MVHEQCEHDLRAPSSADVLLRERAVLIAALSIVTQQVLMMPPKTLTVANTEQRDAECSATLVELPFDINADGRAAFVQYRKLGPMIQQASETNALLFSPGEHLSPVKNSVQTADPSEDGLHT